MTPFVMVEAAFHDSAIFIPDGNSHVDTWREAVIERVHVNVMAKKEIPGFVQGLERRA
jgi:hypothetical protein